MTTATSTAVTDADADAASVAAGAVERFSIFRDSLRKKKTRKEKSLNKKNENTIYLCFRQKNKRLQDQVVAFDFRSGITNIIRRCVLCVCVDVHLPAGSLVVFPTKARKQNEKAESNNLLKPKLFIQKHIQYIYYFE